MSDIDEFAAEVIKQAHSAASAQASFKLVEWLNRYQRQAPYTGPLLASGTYVPLDVINALAEQVYAIYKSLPEEPPVIWGEVNYTEHYRSAPTFAAEEIRWVTDEAGCRSLTSFAGRLYYKGNRSLDDETFPMSIRRWALCTPDRPCTIHKDK